MEVPSVRTDPESPAELVRRAALGDAGAEAALLRRFAPAVRSFARRRLRSPEAVEEMTQDVFLVLVEALRRGRVAEPERVGGFVLGICRNLVRERAKARGRREELWAQFGHVLGEAFAEPAGGDPYEVTHLEDCLSQLTSRARDVVRLTYVDGRSNADIAQRLTLSEANVRVLRHRTLKVLRECLSKPMPWETLS